MVAARPFDQELANSFELGLKWSSQDQRLRLRTALFHTDYQDLQVLELFSPADSAAGDLGVSMTLNAADARSRGLEAEFAYAPTPRWILSGGYAWLDARYTRFFLDQDLGFRFTNPIDRTGNRLRNAPQHSLNLNAEYRHPLAAGGEVVANLNWSYQSKNYQDAGNLEYSAIPAYSLTNLRLAWRPHEDLELAAWVDNLLDEPYLIHGFAVGPNGLATPGPPRTFGLNLRYQF
jgi:iron complex outermembrane receptor protein